ncbi:ABC transporter permease [Clostridium sp. CF012]|uniref:ABC transporter permease n=1 Tax=Clostridium sp. CF012 TaxID=2843319 RepID=UPI001C0ABF78|nr:FtsX-like permease family protein [Clostridium sp. CF012]MBU3143448.1 FtsX-like permease family protein [Clostridium sp. CF012]
MKIIVKFLLNNIKEKKFRTFLIIFSIMMSAALYFASSAMSTTIVEMVSDLVKSYVGSAEITVSANEKSPSSFLYVNKADSIKGDMDYIIGSIQLTGSFKDPNDKDVNININLNGYDLKELETLSSLVFENEVKQESFAGKKIIISKNTSEKYKLKSGDFINIDIKDGWSKFKVVGIAEIAGLFLSEKQNTMGIVPKDVLYNMGEGRGKVSILYIKTKNPLQKQNTIDKLSKIYKDYDVREPISDKDLKDASNGIVVPLKMMGMVVLAISMFIIYSAFKVITAERIPTVGTFRSIGATKKMMNLVLLGESIIYGIIGGITGIIVGFGVLYLMATIFAQMFGGIKTTIKYTTDQMIGAFILAVTLSLISSILPIIRVSKISVKDIVLNNVTKNAKNKHWKLIFGIIVVLFATIAPRIAPKKSAGLIDGLAMLLVFVATVYLVPYITVVFVMVLEKLYSYIFGNEGVIAAKNLKGNKNVLNNIALLAIGMSALLMISTISSSMAMEVPRVYKQMNFQILVRGGDLNGEFQNKIKNLKGVEGVYGIFQTSQVKVNNSKETIGEVDGVNNSKFLDYYDMKFIGDKKAILTELSMGRNMIITKSLGDRLNLAKGNKLTLELNKVKREYRVVGVVDYQMNNGNMAFIPEKYFKQDMNVQNYSQFCVKTNIAASSVKKAIDKKYSKSGVYTETIEAMTIANVEANALYMTLLNGFAIMAMVIGSFGIINNFMISFMDRKRSIAMFRSLGMSKKQNIKILFIESFTGGAIGGVVGILSSILLVSISQYLMDATLNVLIPMHYSVKTFSVAFILGILVMIIASIGPASKSSKLNIIEAIKYE